MKYNKVTVCGDKISKLIQNHIDEMNAKGYELIGIEGSFYYWRLANADLATLNILHAIPDEVSGEAY